MVPICRDIRSRRCKLRAPTLLLQLCVALCCSTAVNAAIGCCSMLQRRIHCRNFALQHVAALLSVLQSYVTVCCRATVVATTVCFIYCSDANCVYGIGYCDVLQRYGLST